MLLLGQGIVIQKLASPISLLHVSGKNSLDPRCLLSFSVITTAPFRESRPSGMRMEAEQGRDRDRGRPMVVRAVLFDLDDTLVSTDATNQVACSRAVELLHSRYPTVRGQDVADSFWKAFIPQPWDPHNQMDVTEWRAQLWHRSLQEQGVDDIALARDIQDCFDMTRMASFKWLPGVEQIVRDLQAQGIKTCIITNGHPKVQRDKLGAAEASKLFDVILVGGEEAHEKPHPSIFLKACKLVGSRPEESIMVGDNLKTDIQGAMNANLLAAVWVNVHRIADTREDVTVRPSYTISNVLELPQVLSLIQ